MADSGTDLTTTNATFQNLVLAVNNLSSIVESGGVVGPEIVAQLTDLVAAVGELTTINATLLAGNTALGVINTTLSTVFPLVTITGGKTYDPPSIAVGASTTTTVTVTGAIKGQFVVPSFSLDLTGITLTAYVSSANTVTFVLANLTAAPVDLPQGTIAARVFG